ncbi:MAG: hypothetical protein ACD_20C00085G0016 [uncultured bacterium]|nr:MAG: hypothetical protein ACD_20C00085G0016 [uncultured bacterium]HBH17535.1 hypothetical protein [Cyanobacteria bacterium UBA9579]
MNSLTKIILIPLDNRPVSYTLPVQIGQLNNNVEVLVPPRELIGGLTHNTNVDNVLLWLNETIQNNKIDFIVCSLDTIAYGGLIPSRRNPDTEAMIMARLSDFKILIENHKKEHNTRLYAFSSIMRISNNNINEEEKEYWDKYGELIFKFSYLTHKIQLEDKKTDKDELREITNQIPEEVLRDYLLARKRNFDVNKYYLSWIEDDFIDFMVYSQDDTAQYGLNVMEGKALQGLISEKDLSSKITVQTGADEIPDNLLIRGLVEKSNQKLSIFPVFSTEKGPNIISRYEDRTILESAFGQTNLCGAQITDSKEKADIILLVHTPANAQNDYAMSIYEDPENEKAIELCINIIKTTDKPVILADIAFANGADNLLAKKLLADGVNLDILYGYAGWNTTGNTLGSSLSMGISRYLAEKSGNLNFENFKKLLLIRISDDWAYQTVTRQKIRALTHEADTLILNEELKPLIINLAKKVNLTLSKIELSFPWNRTFEVEINIET